MDGVLCFFNKDASIEEVATKGYFRKRFAQWSVVLDICSLLKDENIEGYILSSVFMDDHSIAEKNQWLDKHEIDIDEDHRLFIPYGTSKSEFLRNSVGIRDDDFLLDDFSKNLHKWHGIGIKLYNDINGTKGTWTGYSVNAKSSSDVIKNTLLGIMQFASPTEKQHN